MYTSWPWWPLFWIPAPVLRAAGSCEWQTWPLISIRQGGVTRLQIIWLGLKRVRYEALKSALKGLPTLSETHWHYAGSSGCISWLSCCHSTVIQPEQNTVMHYHDNRTPVGLSLTACWQSTVMMNLLSFTSDSNHMWHIYQAFNPWETYWRTWHLWHEYTIPYSTHDKVCLWRKPVMVRM